MTDFRQLLGVLTRGGVEFIIIGGAAATAHGASRLTEDIDVMYRRTADNIARLAEALAPVDPYLRGAPPGLPFKWDEKTVRNGLNFTLTTKYGPIVLLGEITGGGSHIAFN
jgi:hypothetical protein